MIKDIRTIEENKIYGFTYDDAELHCYLNPPIRALGIRHRKCVIICPGGGFETIEEREGIPVALRFMGYGYQSFVLRYRIGHGAYRIALSELQDSIAFIRRKSDEWEIDPNQIIVVGFSVGGFLGLGVSSDCYTEKDYYGMDKPNAMILGYPVVTSGEYAHEPSMKNSIDEVVKRDRLSMEKNVSREFPPCFLWACADDEDVDIRNTLLLSNAFVRNGIDFEVHIWSKGGHGISLGDDTTARIENQINVNCSKWFLMAHKWLDKVL